MCATYRGMIQSKDMQIWDVIMIEWFCYLLVGQRLHIVVLWTCTSVDSKHFDHRKIGSSLHQLVIPFGGLLGTMIQRFWSKVVIFRAMVHRGTLTQKRLHGWFLDSRSSKYYDLNISAIVAPMTKPTCRDMCKDKIHMLYEGFDDLTIVWWGTSLPNRGAPLLKQQRQQAPKRWYLFHLKTSGREILQRHVQIYNTCVGPRDW